MFRSAVTWCVANEDFSCMSKVSRSESILQYYDLLYHLLKSLNASRFLRRILECNVKQYELGSHTNPVYNKSYTTSYIYQKKRNIKGLLFYSLYVHMCLRNANTSDMREEEHEALNRIKTYFDLYLLPLDLSVVFDNIWF